MVSARFGILTLICGVLGFLATEEAIGLFAGFLIGFLIESNY